MKGQIFIAGATMIIVIFALIRGMFLIPNLPETIIGTSSQLDNLANEYRYATNLSARDGLNDIYALSEYFRANVNGFNAIYALIRTSNSNTYTITIGNFMRNAIELTINTGSSFALSDKNTWNSNFTEYGDVTLMLSYKIQNKIYSQQLNFTTNKIQTIGWFDIGIQEGGNNIRRSDVWVVS